MVLVSKRGRFLVGELLFERGGQIELGGGRRAATPGRMALVELGQGRGRARVVRQLGDPRLAADVLDAMLEDSRVRVGFSRRIEEEAGEAAARGRGPRRRPAGPARSADLHRRPGKRPRLRRRRLRVEDRARRSPLDPHRRRGGPRSPGGRRWRRRPTGGRTPPTSPAASRRCSRMCSPATPAASLPDGIAWPSPRRSSSRSQVSRSRRASTAA